MFINVSNHPCNAEKTTWSTEQITAAAELGGKVVDFGFPVVTPDMTDEQIAQICHATALDVAGMASSEKSAAMVAGEYVTTIRIIAELEAMGVPCYFGQSARVAEERVEDGKVVVIHKFVFQGFRKAPEIKLM